MGVPLMCMGETESFDLGKKFQMKQLLNSSFMNDGLCINQCFNKNFIYSFMLEK